MREVGMMMTSTDEPGWPGYNGIIDIFPHKGMGTGLELGREWRGGGGEVCAKTLWVFLIIMKL